MTDGGKPVNSTPASPGATARPHVLIVSDDPDLSDFLAQGLLYAGFWTSVVASGIQTLEVFRWRGFDLVLVDSALRGLSALELIRRLRGRADRAPGDAARTDVPILLVADTGTEIEPRRLVDVSIDDVLRAPLDLEVLAPRLHRLVQAWRIAHPDRPMADAMAQRQRTGDE